MVQVNGGFFRVSKAQSRLKPVVLLASHEPIRPWLSGFSGFNQAIGALALGLNRIGIDAAVVAPFAGGVDVRRDNAEVLRINDASGVNQEVRVFKYERRDDYPLFPLFLMEKVGDPQFFAFGAYQNSQISSITSLVVHNQLFAEKGKDTVPLYASVEMNHASKLFNSALVGLANAFKEILSPGERFVFHGNDHVTSLAAARLASSNVCTVFTIHNPAYRTHVKPEFLRDSGFNPEHIVARKDGSADVMSLALKMADKVTTVAPAYAKEIGCHGFAIDDLQDGQILDQRGDDFSGILNGLLPRFLEPVQHDVMDGHAVTRFLFGGRLDRQKGYDLLVGAYPAFATQQDADVMRINIFGNGDETIANRLKAMQADLGKSYPLLSLEDYNERRFLEAFRNPCTTAVMPSVFEPLGLFGMTAQAKGALLMANPVGGLKDVLGRDQYNAVISRALEGSGASLHEYGLAFSPRDLRDAKGMPKLLSFARALLAVARARRENPEIFDPIIAAAQKRAQEYYTPERVATDYMEKVYEPLLG